jgi:hypothetical protein
VLDWPASPACPFPTSREAGPDGDSALNPKADAEDDARSKQTYESRSSRRQLPIQRSVVPFCQGACTCSFRCQTRRLQERGHGIVELRASIQDHITIGGRLRKRVTQLRDDPIRRRVSREMKGQDLTTSVLD